MKLFDGRINVFMISYKSYCKVAFNITIRVDNILLNNSNSKTNNPKQAVKKIVEIMP